MTNPPNSFHDQRLLSIVEEFRIQGMITSIAPLGSGHINDTFLVSNDQPGSPGYILQRINHHVFRNVPELMRNIGIVTDHIKQTIRQASPLFDHFRIMEPAATPGGLTWHHDALGNYWRLYPYLDCGTTAEGISSPAMAFEGGKAFGIFQLLTSGIEPGKLTETIPGFHSMSLRLKNFREKVGGDPVSRCREASAEIRFVEERACEMLRIEDLCQRGIIPVRVTHNDTKINNVLFDAEGRAVSVIDLDTVMPGTVLYDFGDAIRTGASTAAEDEPDRSAIHIDLALFEGYTRGYISVAGRFLTPAEADLLAFSARCMTYIIGLRFLTDHLDGDRYYKTRFPGHNLQRARAQFALLESMESHSQAMEVIVAKSFTDKLARPYQGPGHIQ